MPKIARGLVEIESGRLWGPFSRGVSCQFLPRVSSYSGRFFFVSCLIGRFFFFFYFSCKVFTSSFRWTIMVSADTLAQQLHHYFVDFIFFILNYFFYI
jgi:hypothetical protein